MSKAPEPPPHPAAFKRVGFLRAVPPVPEASPQPLAHAEVHRLVVEYSADVIVRGDAALGRTYVSPSSLDVLGYTPEEMLGRHAYELVHPDDEVAVDQAFGLLGPDHRRADCVFRMRHAAGHYVWMEATYRYVAEDGGVLAVLRDITVRKQVEANLADTHRQLESVNAMLSATLEHMAQGVCFFDGQSRLLLSNRRYAEIYSLAPELMRPGSSLSEIIAHRYAAGAGAEMRPDDYLAWRASISTVNTPLESEVRLQNGKTVLIRHHPLPDGGWVATHEDITERHRTEAMLHQAQKLEAVGRLTGGIAHDFNNLLQTVGTALEMVALTNEVQADAQLRHLVADAALAVEQGGQITQQLLTFSRKQTLRPALADIRQLIDGMTGLLRQACGENIAMVLSLPADGAFQVFLDLSQFRSALLNLAINARDAMPGGGALTIAVRTVALTGAAAVAVPLPAGRYVCVEVQDSGQGIDQAHLAHVFEPFFTTKEIGEGSGLGLAQVYGFAHQSGGSVSIASAPGAGTTVSLLLPLADAATMQAAAP